MGILANRKVLEVTAAVIIFLSVIGLVSNPAETTDAAKDGLLLCYNVIIPSLFPFFVLSTMVVELGLARYLGRALDKIMRPLFNVSGACAMAFALGFIGGYPTGARTAISIYENGLCTKREAERLLSFCNNSGPAFILGVVGAGVFSSSKAGILLYLAHAVSSIIVGIIFRFYGREKGENKVYPAMQIETVQITTSFTKAVVSSFQSTINICAFVVFFTVAIRMLFMFGIIPFVADILGVILTPIGGGATDAERLLTGMIEISSGVWSLRDAATGAREQLAMAAFMLGWAGISVHCQVLSFIGQSGLTTRTYIVGKILHGLISAILVYSLAGLFRFEAPVASYLVEQLDGIVSQSFSTSLFVSLSSSVAVLTLIALPMIVKHRKRMIDR